MTAEQSNNAIFKAQHTTTYEYENVFHFLKKRSWYKDANTPLSESYTYESQGRIASVTDSAGRTTQYIYTDQADGLKVTEIRPLENDSQGNSRIMKSETLFGIEAQKAYPTKTVVFYKDAAGNAKQTQATRTYNLLTGEIVSETDNAGRTSAYEYDLLGRTTKITYPNYIDRNGATIAFNNQFEYVENAVTDLPGTYIMVKSKQNYRNITNGQLSACAIICDYYDNWGRLHKRKALRADGSTGPVTRYTFDAMGRPTSMTDPSGNTVTNTYDKWGNLLTGTDALGNTYKLQYNLTGRKTTSSFTAQGSTTEEYVVQSLKDQWGRKIEQRLYPNWPDTAGQKAESYSYDIEGNLVSYTDPKGQTTGFQTDNIGNLIKVTDAMGQITEYGYTGHDKLKSVKKTNGVTNWITSKEYDERGFLLKRTDPEQKVETASINELGLLTQTTDPNQNQFAYTYDTQNRITSIAGMGITRKYGYAAHPFGVESSELYEGTSLKSAKETYYDEFGRLNAEYLNYDNYQNGISYTYDLSGKPISKVDPFRLKVEYTYTKTQPTSATFNNNAGASGSTSYEYNPVGTVKSVSYPVLHDGSYLKTQYTYDKLNRMTMVVNKKGDTLLSQYSYTYDDNNNVTSVTDAGGITNYQYDALNRLTMVTRPNGEQQISTYDVKGNRITTVSVLPADIEKSVYYQYNGLNQLTEAVKGDETVKFDYDPNGMRIKKTAGEEITRYSYDAAGRLIAEQDEDNKVKAQYVWGPTSVMALVYNNQSYYYLTNGHGDVVQIVDSAGNVANSYSYDEWGNILSQTETVPNSFKYAGETYDEETGLYYLRARYYDPITGRFINKDSFEGDITNPLSLNLYAYCAGNPIRYTDPSGQFGEEIGNGLNYVNEKYVGGPLDRANPNYMAPFAVGYVGTTVAPAYALTQLVLHPVTTTQIVAKTTADIVTHPVDSTVAAATAVRNTVVNDVINGDSKSRSMVAGSLVAIAVPSVKGISANAIKRPGKVVFPENPGEFNPSGLIRKEYNNGKIVKWQDPKTGKAVYEWNADAKYGDHYHYTPDGKTREVHPETGDTHIKPGSTVPKRK